MNQREERRASAGQIVEEGEFLRRCGSLLLGLPADKAINRILALLGRAHRSDRAWLIRYNQDFTHFWNTHEWARSGSSEHVVELQGIPVEMGAWMHETLLKNKAVYIQDSKRMPRRAKALQSEFMRQSIRSLLSVPVFYRGKLMLQIGYDTTTHEGDWSEEEIWLLREVGRLFALRLFADSAPPAFQPDVEEKEDASIHLQESSVHRRIMLDQVTHITADGDYSRMNFLNAPSASDNRSLRYWESALSPRRFVRISRSVIVNCSRIQSLDRRGGIWRLQLRGLAEPLTVGRSYRADLKHRLES
ncbi:LytTR family transcriptional regulator DNA-binding domain-containing protein [Puniceicoccus vermicola]|uniref:GAF domain-containing DNA-binding protein n=1 Tax=Puniceicoccus vermicola TaxID=388746 RepID=A0A7X1E369_9BACT|nr:GAF domain-containing DNA-binding protein [Puniceicoccus vermicola]